MSLKQIEARIAKLEAVHRANPFAGMSEEEIERQLVSAMDRVAVTYGGDYAATTAALQASSDPVDQDAAKGFAWFIERQRQQREYSEWCAAVMAEQAISCAAACSASSARR